MNQTRPHITIFCLIYWEEFKGFSLIMNSVKIPSEKDKKNTEYFLPFNLIPQYFA